MNENDLRDCFAMFAMLGWAMNGDFHETEIPNKAYKLADAMLEARKAEPEQEVGIVAVKSRRKKND
jgi:hypothetical protein